MKKRMKKPRPFKKHENEYGAQFIVAVTSERNESCDDDLSDEPCVRVFKSDLMLSIYSVKQLRDWLDSVISWAEQEKERK